MSLTGCAVGEMVAWPPMRELAENIDALAVALNTPGYTPLLGITDAPFQFEDKVAATGQFYQFFSLAGATVTDRYLSSDAFGASVYTFPETNLGNLMQHDELFFVMDQDNCLCKTLFKVEGTPESPTFTETSASGCCQSIPVPEVGALVYQNQHFFPSAILAGYFGASFDDCCECCSPSPNLSQPACLGSADATMQVKSGPADGQGCFPVTGVSRNIVSGYFTWPFKKRYMELLVDKLDYILQCSRNDGIKPQDAATPAAVSEGSPGATLSMYGAIYSVDGGTTNSGWFKQGSTCSTQQTDQWLASLWIEGTILNTEPGTLVYGTGLQLSVVSKTERGNTLSVTETRGAETIPDSPYDLPRPWDGPTPPDATDCSNGLPMVYAYTLNKLNDLVTEISERVWPYGTFDEPSHTGTCDEVTLVPCCDPDNGYTGSSHTARSCEQLGGRVVADSAECDALLEALCGAKTVRYCGSDVPCTYYPGTGCICPPESCYEYFTCCNVAATSEEYACADPVSLSNFECPSGYIQATFCNSATEGNCCFEGTVVEGVEPVGTICPDHPGPGELEGEPLDYCEVLTVECGSFPQAYDVYYSDQPDAPSYPELPACANQNPCCLRHPSFESGTFKGCLSYLDEIQAWVALVTDGIIDSCQYADSRFIDPTDPDSLVENCQEIRCGLVCEGDYATLSAAAEECLNQAQIMYLWQRREVNPDDTSAGWPLSTYYDIVFSAPSPI
jgi:hypothetical protein